MKEGAPPPGRGAGPGGARQEPRGRMTYPFRQPGFGFGLGFG